ncbi:MAG: class I SAM-dependent methyltransferase [Candidatus Doudnabacteria bacterium]|nr:class I SAM-dependent methyltransferase [Candidatus Doudnabacteria bacterium]
MNHSSVYQYVPVANHPFLTRWYDFGCWILGLGPKFKKQVLDAVEIWDGATILDVGCGTGVLLELAKRKFPNSRVIGIDPDKPALALARSRTSRAGLDVELHEAFAESLPLADEESDFCFTSLALHHIPGNLKKQAIQEMYRVLKKGGWVVVADLGQTDSRLMRFILSFEPYAQGNLAGLIEKYLPEAGFKNLKLVGRKYPGIKILVGEK